MKFMGRRIFDGFVLLLPLILSYILFGALFDLLMALTIPITDFLPGRLFSNEWDQRFAAAAILLVLCFLIGLADQTETFRRAGDWLERRIFGRFAPYSVLRSFSSRLSATDVPDKLQPALVDNGNARQLAFVVEEHGNGDVRSSFRSRRRRGSDKCKSSVPRTSRSSTLPSWRPSDRFSIGVTVRRRWWRASRNVDERGCIQVRTI